MKILCTEIKVGLTVVVGLSILGFFIAKAQDLSFSKKGYFISAVFSDVQGLKPKANVHLAGVKIGEVKNIAIDYESGSVRVSLWIMDGVKIARSSRAIIAVGGFFGDKRIWLNMGDSSEGFLAAGDELTTEKAFDLTAALSSLANTLGKAEDFIDSGTDLMTSLKSDAGKISERVIVILDENRENVRRLISSFADAGPEIKDAAERASRIFARIEESDGTIWKLLNEDDVYNDIRQITSDIREVVTRNKANISALLGSLGEASGSFKAVFAGIQKVVDKISKGEGTLGKLVNDESMYNETKRTIREIGDAAEGVRDQSSLGSLVSIGISAAK